MKLYEYLGKKIKLTTVSPCAYGSVFWGIAEDYTDAEDNEPQIVSICIDNIEFPENHIKSIEILK